MLMTILDKNFKTLTDGTKISEAGIKANEEYYKNLMSKAQQDLDINKKNLDEVLMYKHLNVKSS